MARVSGIPHTTAIGSDIHRISFWFCSGIDTDLFRILIAKLVDSHPNSLFTFISVLPWPTLRLPWGASIHQSLRVWNPLDAHPRHIRCGIPQGMVRTRWQRRATCLPVATGYQWGQELLEWHLQEADIDAETSCGQSCWGRVDFWNGDASV